MTDLPIPNFSYNPDLNKGKLKEKFVRNTGIEGHSADLWWCLLLPNGVIRARKNYEWDFATGAVDTISMAVPTLVHDIFCQLTNEGAVPWSVREQGDRLFRELLKEYGVGVIRRTYCYIAVRLNSKNLA